MDLKNQAFHAAELLEAQGINEYEVWCSSVDTVRAERRERCLHAVNHAREGGVAVRVIVDGSLGFAYAREASAALVDAALTTARYREPDPQLCLPDAQPEGRAVEDLDSGVVDLDAGTCVERATELEDAVYAADERIASVRRASYSRTVEEVCLVNSRGLSCMARDGLVSTGATAMASSGEDRQIGSFSDFNRDPGMLDVCGVGREAADNATRLIGARRMDSCSIPVLFDEDCTASLLGLLVGSFNGERLSKGTSRLAGRRGEHMFGDIVTLCDDPLDVRGADNCPFDGEGVASRRTVFVQSGVIEEFYYDTYWARRCGEKSTASAVRGSYRSIPRPGIRHLVLEPGNGTLADDLKGLKQYLNVTDIMGMHTADPISGDFSVGVSGIFCMHGGPGYPVREAAVAGNIFEIFSRVMSIGEGGRRLGSVTTPAVLVDTLDISSRREE